MFMQTLEKPPVSDKETFLKDIIATSPNTLKAAIAREALDYHGIEAFFKDILTYGCKSGLVSGLIYTADIQQYFNRYYREIEGIRRNIEQNLGESLSFSGDLVTGLVWTAYEDMSVQMAVDMGVLS